MYAFLARRLLATIPVLLIVAVLVFLMLRLTPGDPAAILAGDAANTEQIARIRASLGLDQPIVVQFGIWVVVGFSGLARDISERIALRRAAEADSARLLATQTLAHVGSCELDLRTGTFTRSWNCTPPFRSITTKHRSFR